MEVLKLEIQDMKNLIEIKEDKLRIVQTEVEEKVTIIEKMKLTNKYLEDELK